MLVTRLAVRVEQPRWIPSATVAEVETFAELNAVTRTADDASVKRTASIARQKPHGSVDKHGRQGAPAPAYKLLRNPRPTMLFCMMAAAGPPMNWRT